jgi:hypothetical protein
VPGLVGVCGVLRDGTIELGVRHSAAMIVAAAAACITSPGAAGAATATPNRNGFKNKTVCNKKRLVTVWFKIC